MVTLFLKTQCLFLLSDSLRKQFYYINTESVLDALNEQVMELQLDLVFCILGSLWKPRPGNPIFP